MDSTELNDPNSWTDKYFKGDSGQFPRESRKIIHGNPVRSPGILIIICGKFLGIDQIFLIIIEHVHVGTLRWCSVIFLFSVYLQICEWLVQLLTRGLNLPNTFRERT